MRAHLVKSLPMAFTLAGTAAAHGQSVTVLHGFSMAIDGGVPMSGVIVMPNGYLAGTATQGGPGTGGTVFGMAPPAHKGKPWFFRVAHRFDGFNSRNGGSPIGGLTLGPNGVVYGAASYGGKNNGNSGIVYQLSPPVAPSSIWKGTTLYNFIGETQIPGDADAALPQGKVYVDASGNLFGSAIDGGTQNYGTGITQNGAWWKLAPPAAGQTTWSESLTGWPGQDPAGGVIADGTGRVYGTSEYGNLLNAMLFFSIGTPSWTVDGGYERNGLRPSDPVLGSDGALYATVDSGPPLGQGLVLRLPVTGGGSTPGKIQQIYAFKGGVDGSDPAGPLVAGPSGSFYGTTAKGGANGFGTIFQITPPASGTAWSHTVLWSFDSTATTPSGPLTPGPNGVFYGTTQGGSGSGTVYQFTP